MWIAVGAQAEFQVLHHIFYNFTAGKPKIYLYCKNWKRSISYSSRFTFIETHTHTEREEQRVLQYPGFYFKDPKDSPENSIRSRVPHGECQLENQMCHPMFSRNRIKTLQNENPRYYSTLWIISYYIQYWVA